jgi:hypothetical protein
MAFELRDDGACRVAVAERVEVDGRCPAKLRPAAAELGGDVR